MKMLSQQGAAETVYRADIGAGKKHQLALEPQILRPFGNQAGQLGAQPLLHLGGGRFGEGHDQQAIDVRAVGGGGDAAHDPFHQDGGFAGAGRGGNQQGAAAGFNALQLFRGPLTHRAASFQSAVLGTSSFQTSSASFSAMRRTGLSGS